MNRLARSLCIVGAMLAVVFALAAPSFAGCAGCQQMQQVQAVYSAPLVQQVVVPQYQQVYAAPLIQRQVIQQSYVQPVVAQQVLFNKARFVPQRSVQIQRIRQPRVQRQVVRQRSVQQIQVGY